MSLSIVSESCDINAGRKENHVMETDPFKAKQISVLILEKLTNMSEQGLALLISKTYTKRNNFKHFKYYKRSW